MVNCFIVSILSKVGYVDDQNFARAKSLSFRSSNAIYETPFGFQRAFEGRGLSICIVIIIADTSNGQTKACYG